MELKGGHDYHKYVPVSQEISLDQRIREYPLSVGQEYTFTLNNVSDDSRIVQLTIVDREMVDTFVQSVLLPRFKR